MKGRRLTSVIVLLAVIALLAACAPAETEPTPTETASATATGTASPTETSSPTPEDGAGQSIQVTMQNLAFNPENVTIKVGDTIEWVNNDNTIHNVTSSDFESGPMPPGASFSRQFTEAGTIDYFCSLHVGMEGTITVE